MSLSEMYHVGIVVPDVKKARDHFTELLGVEWGPILYAPETEMRAGDGRDVVLPVRLCFTTSPPYLELIEERQGTPWVCNEHSNLHHIGFFSDALTADGDRLSQAACPFELGGRQGDEQNGWRYHRDPLGVRIEFVDASGRPGMEALCQPNELEEIVFGTPAEQ